MPARSRTTVDLEETLQDLVEELDRPSSLCSPVMMSSFSTGCVTSLFLNGFLTADDDGAGSLTPRRSYLLVEEIESEDDDVGEPEPASEPTSPPAPAPAPSSPPERTSPPEPAPPVELLAPPQVPAAPHCSVEDIVTEGIQPLASILQSMEFEMEADEAESQQNSTRAARPLDESTLPPTSSARDDEELQAITHDDNRPRENEGDGAPVAVAPAEALPTNALSAAAPSNEPLLESTGSGARRKSVRPRKKTTPPPPSVLSLVF
jgi:hypothetical protein